MWPNRCRLTGWTNGRLAVALFCLAAAGVGAFAGEAPRENRNAYTRVTILSPPDDAVVRNNAGGLQVLGQVLPKLQNGHRLQLLLDGVAQGAPGRTPRFSLENVDRGTHRLLIRIVDETGRVLFTGTSSTVHLLRHSRLHP